MKKHNSRLVQFRKQIGYHLLVWPGIVFIIIFAYLPLKGLLIAFKDYKLRLGIWDSPWCGLDNFRDLFSNHFLPQTITNTIAIGLLGILVTYPIVIGFALLLNEVRNSGFKRLVQTVSYLPHFISWATMIVILKAMFSSNDGLITELFQTLGITSKPLDILTAKNKYYGLAVFSTVWKEMGWSAILYLAVISGIDPQMYEAAKIDGAGRFARMRFITLPQMKGIIAISLILSVSSIPNVGFDQAYYLGNAINYENARTLTYYAFTQGLQQGDFKTAVSIELVLSMISATMMVCANGISRKLTGKGLY